MDQVLHDAHQTEPDDGHRRSVSEESGRRSEREVQDHRIDTYCARERTTAESNRARLTADAQRGTDTGERGEQYRGLTAVKQQRDKDERVVDGDVQIDLRNADRDARSNHDGDEGEQQKVTVNQAAGKCKG